MFAELLEERLDWLTPISADSLPREKLITYLDRLWQANRQINLFSRKLTPTALVEDHLLDSLLGLPHFPSDAVIGDLGTGGGFPAIPLALCLPNARFQLFEKSVLKGKFLASLTDLVPNIELLERIDDDALADTELITARAFKPMKVILSMTPAYYRSGRSYLLYKARLATIEKEIAEARLTKHEVSILRLKKIGRVEERHLVTISKEPSPWAACTPKD